MDEIFAQLQSVIVNDFHNSIIRDVGVGKKIDVLPYVLC